MIAWMALAFAGEISGRLTSVDGQAIEGATVLAYDSRFAYGYATSRIGGEWTIAGLPEDRYRIRFLPANGDPHGDRFYGGAWDACAAESRLVSGTVGDVDSVLEVGASVSGRVVDLAGEPIPDMQVTVYGAEPRTSLISRSDVTDEEGGFEVVGLDAELTGSAFNIHVKGEGWPAQYLGAAYAEAYSERASLAAGSAFDVGDMALLDGIRVSGVISGPSGPVSSGSAFVYSSQQVLAAPIQADGTYVADGLPPGEVVTWAQSPGLGTTYFPDLDRPGGTLSVPNEGDDARIDLTLPEESTLTLVFSGEGLLDEVSVLVYNDTYTVGRGDSVAADGTVTLTGLYPGDFYVYVYGEDGGFPSGFILDDDGERLTFPVDGPTQHAWTLPMGASVSGTVTDEEGNPVYGATIAVTETTGERRDWTTTTDRDGSYTVLGVDKTTVTVGGSYYWYCSADPGWAPMWYDASRSQAGAGVLLLDHGTVVEDVDLELPADNDHDAMGDAWEREQGLDPSRDDGAADPDLDGYTNAEEWQLGTDPTGAAPVEDCGGCAGAGLTGLAMGAGALRRRGRATRPVATMLRTRAAPVHRIWPDSR